MSESKKTIEERFKTFHEKNPHVYKQLEQMSWQLYNQGQKKIGIGMLWEVMRWRSIMRTEGEPYKLSNDLRSRYVRMLIDNNPEFEDFFSTRELRSA